MRPPLVHPAGDILAPLRMKDTLKMPQETDPFPASEFNQWAGQYDADVAGEGFPFTGYQRIMTEVVRLADARAGMSVLDVGTGTGNLAQRFALHGCDVWCTDFSTTMLELARAKVPTAHFFQHDLRQPFPLALLRRFDRIVSAYVFHHFELPEKVEMIARLVKDHLVQGGRLLIADISFPTRPELEKIRRAAGDQWEDEPYWLAAEALPALEKIDPSAAYQQVSGCAGVYILTG
jgi:putative AdoMet-dependent methyltransferase